MNYKMIPYFVLLSLATAMAGCSTGLQEQQRPNILLFSPTIMPHTALVLRNAFQA